MSRKYVYQKGYIRAAMGLYDLIGGVLYKKHSPKETMQPARIVLLALYQIGDVVMTFPSFDAIRKMFPDAELTIIAGKDPAQLLHHNPWQAKIIEYDALWQRKVRQLGNYKGNEDRDKAKTYFGQLLQSLHPDVVLVFHPDLVINQILGRTQIPHTFGFTNAGAGFYLTHPIQFPATSHQVKRNYRLPEAVAEVFGKKAPALSPPLLHVTETSMKEVKQLLADKKIGGKKIAVLHPFASDPARNWLPERWIELAAWLKEHQFTPVMIGGPNDTLSGSTDNDFINFCGALNLVQTSALLKIAAIFIGVNSGPGHIAAAVGCNVVSLFSATHDPKRWTPYGEAKSTIVLCKPPTDSQFAVPKDRELELRVLPPDISGNPYSDKISVDDVTVAIEKLMSK
jgi:heptosyltransferase I